jgi:hypothetical protein
MYDLDLTVVLTVGGPVAVAGVYLRGMAVASGDPLRISAVWKMLKRRELASCLKAAEVIIEGCCGPEADRERFVTNWPRLTTPADPSDAIPLRLRVALSAGGDR